MIKVMPGIRLAIADAKVADVKDRACR